MSRKCAARSGTKASQSRISNSSRAACVGGGSDGDSVASVSPPQQQQQPVDNRNVCFSSTECRKRSSSPDGRSDAAAAGCLRELLECDDEFQKRRFRSQDDEHRDLHEWLEMTMTRNSPQPQRRSRLAYDDNIKYNINYWATDALA